MRLGGIRPGWLSVPPRWLARMITRTPHPRAPLAPADSPRSLAASLTPRLLSRRTLIPAALGLAVVLVLAFLVGGGAARPGTTAARLVARTGAASPAGAVPSPYTFVHDPSMARQDGTYYLFSTGDPAGVIGNGNIQIRTSRNLRSWTYAGTVFADKPSWITAALGSIPNLWAPDISFFGGLWHLYYAGSSFGSNNSVIGLATTPTLDPRSPKYHWTDDGQVFRTSSSDDFNAIDPSLVSTADGNKWLVLGSFWSGIKLIELDPATGRRIAPDSPMYSLAHWDSIEAPYIYKHDAHYYLFASLGMCCRGIDTTYHTRVGRADAVTGPYLDKDGNDMLLGGGTLVTGRSGPFIGPGHAGIVYYNGQSWFSCHFYDGTARGISKLSIRPLTWTKDGWPELGTD